jgi:type II secretory pathway pseudopilin PulG
MPVTGALAAIRRRLAREEGFSLPELLVTCLIGTMVLLVSFSMFDSGQRANARVQDRVEIQQKGRTAMEQVIQQLRSQTCMGVNQPAIVQGDSSSITFYADMDEEAYRPEKRRLTLAGGLLTEEVWTGTGTAPNVTYPVTPARTRVLLRDAVPVDGSTPFLRYYEFDGTAPVTPSRLLAVPLTTGATGKAATPAVPFETYTYVRTADPLDPTHSPQCL